LRFNIQPLPRHLWLWRFIVSTLLEIQHRRQLAVALSYNVVFSTLLEIQLSTTNIIYVTWHYNGFNPS